MPESTSAGMCVSGKGMTDMKIIGITGGVGAGKSQVLEYLRRRQGCRVIIADQVAHALEEPGGACLEQIVDLLGREILTADGSIDKGKMAALIFGDEKLLAQVNGIVHPAVKREICRVIEEERKAGRLRYLFIEAALLIEDGYEQIVDEMWYIHAREQIRRQRLKESRHYPDEKIDRIMQGQLSEAEFYRHCPVVIENNDTMESVYRQIEEKLGEDLWQKQ